MAYTTHVQVRDEILEVRLTGDRSPFEVEVAHEAVEAWAHVLDEAHAAGVGRVLAIFNLSGSTSAVVNVFVASQFGELGFEPGLRVAVVDGNPASQAANEFGCKVAAGHGFGFKAFVDVESARAWLRECAA